MTDGMSGGGEAEARRQDDMAGTESLTSFASAFCACVRICVPGYIVCVYVACSDPQPETLNPEAY